MIVFLILSFWLPLFATNFKDCTDQKEACFAANNSPQKAFQIKAPSNKAAIFIHGLSDSPYFTKDLATTLSQNGYNVYSILLSGHGSSYEALLDVKAENWINDITQAIRQAKLETGATQVTLVGFSLGGVLATALAEDSQWSKSISKIVLLAPAYQVKKNKRGKLMCSIGATELMAWNRPETSIVKYNQMYLAPVCELIRLGDLTKENIKSVQAPVFMVVTDGDQTINTHVALKVYNEISAHKELFHIRNESVSHTDINFKQDSLENRQNPYFDEMARQIVQFLQ